jgi:molybdate transport system permease protein
MTVEAFAHGPDFAAIVLSLKVGATATLLALPFGFAAAYAGTRLRPRGKAAFDTLVNLPLTLPPVVVGYLLLLLLGREGWPGAFLRRHGVQILFTWKAAVIASAVVGFPLLVRSIRISIEAIDDGLVQAARTLGAGRLDTIATIVVPLSLPGIFAGSSLMFARSLGEFGATIVVAGNIPGVTQTLPLAIYDYAASPRGDGMAIALCAVSVAVSVVVLLLHEVVVRKTDRKG